MRNFSVHRSSMSRYMGKTSGYKRSSISRRSSYKLGSNTFKSYLQEAKRAADEIKESEKTEDTDKKTSSLSKYTRTKATSYKTSASKFNSGYDAISDSADSFGKLLAKDETDMDKAYDAAAKFVDGYNDLYASVRSSSSKSVSAKASYISDMAGLYSRTLDSIGITSDKDGKLSIDKDKFLKSDKKDLESVFSKRSSLASHIIEQADSIKLMSALSADTYSGSSSLYGNSYGSSYANGFTSAMSGSLFNRRL